MPGFSTGVGFFKKRELEDEGALLGFCGVSGLLPPNRDVLGPFERPCELGASGSSLLTFFKKDPVGFPPNIDFPPKIGLVVAGFPPKMGLGGSGIEGFLFGFFTGTEWL